MPGLDRTGPFGEGPMTGGRRGYCAGAYPAPLRRGVRNRLVRRGTVPEKFDRIEDALEEILERLDRLESGRE